MWKLCEQRLRLWLTLESFIWQCVQPVNSFHLFLTHWQLAHELWRQQYEERPGLEAWIWPTRTHPDNVQLHQHWLQTHTCLLNIMIWLEHCSYSDMLDKEPFSVVHQIQPKRLFFSFVSRVRMGIESHDCILYLAGPLYQNVVPVKSGDLK